MTQKHFIKLAEILSSVRVEIEAQDWDSDGLNSARYALDRTTSKLVEWLLSENPRFDDACFRRAAR